MRDYQLQPFSQEVRDEIAERFREYFRRKKRRRLTLREAGTLIDYEAGPSGGGFSGVVANYSQPRVSGGGARRPTAEKVQRIYDRHADDEPDEWDAVFDELMRHLARDREVERLALMTFRDGHKWYVICDELHMTKNPYYDAKNAILDRAGVAALKKGALKHWKC